MEERKGKRCPCCGGEIAQGASFCPHCERVLVEKHAAPLLKPRRRRLVSAVVLILLLAGLAAAVLARRGRVIDAQGAELVYTSGEQTFHLVLRFGTQDGAPFESESEFAESVREDRTSGQTIDSRLFVDDGGRNNAKEVFLALVDHFEVEAEPCGGAELLRIERTFLPQGSNVAIEAVPRYETALLKNGESDILWTICMKNGDELRLRHRMRLLRLPVVTYTPDDYPMETTEDLHAIFDMLARKAEENAIYVLRLPAVTYRGELHMESFCCDLIGSGEGEGTTFTDTVYIDRRSIYPSSITNVRFAGNGVGTGLSAAEGVSLSGCTFENWKVGAYGGDGSWVSASDCTFRGNEVGLWLNNRRGTTCSMGYYGGSLYEDNGTAVRIDALPAINELVFSGCVFRGNGANVENAAMYDIDLSGVLLEEN